MAVAVVTAALYGARLGAALFLDPPEGMHLAYLGGGRCRSVSSSTPEAGVFIPIGGERGGCYPDARVEREWAPAASSDSLTGPRERLAAPMSRP